MVSRASRSAMASRSPGSAMASRSPGSAMASRSPGSAMASRSPGSAMDAFPLSMSSSDIQGAHPPPRFCYYVAGRAVREGEVLLENGPYPPSLIAFTCTCLIIRHTCSSSQLITPALLKLTPHSSQGLILKSLSCHVVETCGYNSDRHSTAIC